MDGKGGHSSRNARWSSVRSRPPAPYPDPDSSCRGFILAGQKGAGAAYGVAAIATLALALLLFRLGVRKDRMARQDALFIDESTATSRGFSLNDMNQPQRNLRSSRRSRDQSREGRDERSNGTYFTNGTADSYDPVRM